MCSTFYIIRRYKYFSISFIFFGGQGENWTCLGGKLVRLAGNGICKTDIIGNVLRIIIGKWLLPVYSLVILCLHLFLALGFI